MIALSTDFARASESSWFDGEVERADRLIVGMALDVHRPLGEIGRLGDAAERIAPVARGIGLRRGEEALIVQADHDVIALARQLQPAALDIGREDILHLVVGRRGALRRRGRRRDDLGATDGPVQCLDGRIAAGAQAEQQCRENDERNAAQAGQDRPERNARREAARADRQPAPLRREIGRMRPALVGDGAGKGGAAPVQQRLALRIERGTPLEASERHW